jgi:DNA-binding transcriptional LysR family regulator
LLSLYQLEIFLAVAQERSFSAAARRRHLTQPAVSQQIRALEQALGLALFVRNGQRIELTEAGTQLLPLAGDLTRRADDVEQAMNCLRDATGGRLMIGHGAACFQTLLPRLLRHFRKIAPEIHLQIVAADNRAIVERLAGHEVDFGFVDLRGEGDGLDYTPLFRDRILALVPSRHAWTRRDTISAEELCAAPLVLPAAGTGLRESFNAWLSRNGVTAADLNIVLEIGGADGLGPAVDAGVGISILPRAALRQTPPKVRGVPIASTALEHVVYWARFPSRLPNRAMARFQEFMSSPDTAEFLRREVEEG